MSVSCFLCKSEINIPNTQIKTLKTILNVKSNNDLGNVHNICQNCSNDKIFINIYKYLNENENNFDNINIFISCDDFFVSDKKISSILKKLSNTKKQKNRKEELLTKIKKLKIEYNKSICDEYVKFGKQTLDEVIKKLCDVQSLKNNRLFDLLNELENHDLEYNQELPAFKKYIKHGGNISKTIERAKLEQILANNTDYLSLLNGCLDSETAIELSINQFPNNDDEIINKYIKNKNKLIFG